MRYNYTTVKKLADDKIVEVIADGSMIPLKGETDWEKIRNITDEEIALAAKDDPDCPLLTDEELQQFKRTSSKSHDEQLRQQKLARSYGKVFDVKVKRGWSNK